MTLHQAPSSIYRSYKKGNYTDFTNPRVFDGLDVRLGSYGDPAAVPFDVWEQVLKYSRSNTGYTHQHKHKNFDERIADVCMVSVDTEKQAIQAHRKGYKTFRVKSEGMPNLKGEGTCANEVAGLSCKECGLCDGKIANISITVHGALTKRFDTKFGRIL